MFSFLKTQNAQKIIALALLAILLVAIPLTVWYGQQQQQVQQRAASVIPREQHYTCGSLLTVVLSTPIETPDCTQNSGVVNGLTSFQTTEIIKAAPGSTGAYHVKWAWAQFWCPTEDPHAPCLSSGILTTGEGGLTGDNAVFVTAASAVKTPDSQYAGQACGYYQNDFGFQVSLNDNPAVLCGVSLDINSLAQTNNNASWCHSGVSCNVTTPTPTPTVVTPTPTTPVTPTVTPTPTTPITPTPTTVINTPTPGPSATPTPTTVVTATPKPTLPPTGPGNTIMGIGVLGAAAAVIGTVVLLAL